MGGWIISHSAVFFPTIHRIAGAKRGLVQEMWNSNSNAWNHKLRRNLFDWEMNESARLIMMLEGIRTGLNSDNVL